jgi:hypothetical protein
MSDPEHDLPPLVLAELPLGVCAECGGVIRRRDPSRVRDGALVHEVCPS